MSSRFDSLIKDTLDIEGGFVNDPQDRGGATKWGITLRFYRNYVDKYGQIKHIRTLTKTEAKEIYRAHFWTPAEYVTTDDDGNAEFDYGDLPIGIDRLALSFSINMGWKRSHLLLQKAIASAGGDVSEDGWLGPNTVSEARRVDNKALVREFGIQAATFYANIAVNDTSQTKFLEGWMYRAFREVLDAIEDIHTNES